MSHVKVVRDRGASRAKRKPQAGRGRKSLATPPRRRGNGEEPSFNPSSSPSPQRLPRPTLRPRQSVVDPRRRSHAATGPCARDWERLLGLDALLGPGVHPRPSPSSSMSAPWEACVGGAFGGVPEASGELRQLEQLWQDVGWPQHARDAFRHSMQGGRRSRALDASVSSNTEDAACRVNTEIARLTGLKDALLSTLECIGKRDEAMAALVAALDKHTKPGVGQSDSAGAVASRVRELRRSTVHVCEALKEWRAVSRVQKPFRYRGPPTAQRMLDDMMRLRAHPAAGRLLKPDILAHPLLFPIGKHASGAGESAPRVARLVAAQAILDAELAGKPQGAVSDLAVSPIVLPSPAAPDPRVQTTVIPSVLPSVSAGTPTVQTPAGCASPTEEEEDKAVVATVPTVPAPGLPVSPKAGGVPELDCANTATPKAAPTPADDCAADCADAVSVPRASVAGSVAAEALEAEAAYDDPRCEDAARTLQRFVRAKSARREGGGARAGDSFLHSHEDTLCEEAAPETPIDLDPPTPPFTPPYNKVFRPRPTWLRYTSRRAPLATAAQQRDFAAAAIQVVWRQVRAAKAAAAELRHDREKLRAASTIVWHLRIRAERIEGRRRAAAAAAARAAYSAKVDAGLLQYNSALAVLRRCASGAVARMRCRALGSKRRLERLDEKARVITRTARRYLALKHAEQRRDQRAREFESRSLRARRECAAVRVQAVFRGHLARRHTLWGLAASTRRGWRLVDQCEARRRAALRVQRAVRRYLGRLSLRALAAAKAAALRSAGAQERQWWGAVLLQSVWRGWRARRAYVSRYKRRLRWRSNHVPKAGERYRGVTFDELYIAELAEQANHRCTLLSNSANVAYASERRQRCLGEPVCFSPTAAKRKQRLANARQASPTFQSGSAQDREVSTSLEQLANWSRLLRDADITSGDMHRVDSPSASSTASRFSVPVPHPADFLLRCRSDPLESGFLRIRLTLLCLQRLHPQLVGEVIVHALADFASRSTRIGGTRVCIDLSRVPVPGAEGDDDPVEHLTNSLLRLPQPTLVSLLDGVYAEQPEGAPSFVERWDIVVVLVNVASEWGIHAFVELANELSGPGGEGTVFECLLESLGLDGADGLTAYLRKDAAQLGYDERVSADVRGILCQALRATRGEELTKRVYEMGLRQIVGVASEKTVADLLVMTLHELPTDLTREQAEGWVVRVLLY